MTREQFISEVRACQGSLRRFLASLCSGDTSRADDMAQEALVRAYIHSDGFNGNFKAPQIQFPDRLLCGPYTQTGGMILIIHHGKVL